MKPTNKDMADSRFFWGVSKIYRYGIAVHATSYGQVIDKMKVAIDRSTTKLAKEIKNGLGTAKQTACPGPRQFLKCQALFFKNMKIYLKRLIKICVYTIFTSLFCIIGNSPVISYNTKALQAGCTQCAATRPDHDSQDKSI